MQRLPFFQWLQALSILLCFMLPCTLHAGAVPDAGTIERTLPKPPKTLPIEFEKPLTDEKEVIDVGPKILIKDFDFIGNKVITTEALSMLVAPKGDLQPQLIIQSIGGGGGVGGGGGQGGDVGATGENEAQKKEKSE